MIGVNVTVGIGPGETGMVPVVVMTGVVIPIGTVGSTGRTTGVMVGVGKGAVVGGTMGVGGTDVPIGARRSVDLLGLRGR